ncbi:MAG: hypothetical protein EXQ99_02895 [Alphaproteobacteria bacterium]|nr:hypothetical protein [Alphaproteobacteria bacterium]
MERRKIGEREVLLEFCQVGDYMKVIAIDAVTLREVSIVGSPRTPEPDLIRLVMRKLDFNEAREAQEAKVAKKNEPPSGDGILA